MCMTCGLSGNALVPSEPLYTELVCRRRQSPPFSTLARAESPYVVWSFPGGRAEHESAELFLQVSLQSKVTSVMKEKCSAPSCSTTFRRPLSKHCLWLRSGGQSLRPLRAWLGRRCPRNDEKPISGTPVCFERSFDFRPSSGDWA